MKKLILFFLMLYTPFILAFDYEDCVEKEQYTLIDKGLLSDKAFEESKKICDKKEAEIRIEREREEKKERKVREKEEEKERKARERREIIRKVEARLERIKNGVFLKAAGLSRNSLDIKLESEVDGRKLEGLGLSFGIGYRLYYFSLSYDLAEHNYDFNDTDERSTRIFFREQLFTTRIHLTTNFFIGIKDGTVSGRLQSQDRFGFDEVNNDIRGHVSNSEIGFSSSIEDGGGIYDISVKNHNIKGIIDYKDGREVGFIVGGIGLNFNVVWQF